MNELQQNFVHWRSIIFKINISIAVITGLCEIAMTFPLYFQHLIYQETLLDYFHEYLIRPNLIIWGTLFALWLIFKYVKQNGSFFRNKYLPYSEGNSLYDEILNTSLIFALLFICTTVCYVHYIFHVTLIGLCLPLLLSIVFYSRKLCVETIAACEVSTVIVAVHRFSRQGLADKYILEDIIIAVIIILVVGYIALEIIKHMKAQYEQVNEARKEAVIANQAKSSFLANMSHDIRTPINAVMGMDEMILRKSEDEEVLSYAADIKQASGSLLSIINDILDVSKIESGKMEILPVEYHLDSLVRDVYNSVAIKAHDKELELKLEVDGSLPRKLVGDDVRLKQIIINLLSNAVKYTLKGSVTLQIGGTVSETGDSVFLSVRVSDTGIGIKKEDLPKLTEKFQRIEESRNRNIEGTGLGMSIVVSLLDLMGSSIQVESEYGVGSCFSFDVKQGVASREPIGNLSERFVNSPDSCKYKQKARWLAPKAKLLVVDDNALNLKVFTGLLKPYMMRVDKAKDGQECIEKAKQVQYDIIFLDDMMPGMDGTETLHYLQKMENNPCAQTPVVALTANAVKGAAESYLQKGFSAYLAKPMNPEKLEKIILGFLPPEVVEYHEENSESVESEADPGKNAGDRQTDESGISSLPEIPGINWQSGLSVWCDENLLLELVRDFYNDLPSVRDFLSEQVGHIDDEESMKSFCIRVHSLKGSAASIGALQLSSMALILEKASKEQNPEKVKNLWPYLEELIGEYLENMKVLDAPGA